MPKLFLSFSLALLLITTISPLLPAQTANISDQASNESLISQLSSQNIDPPATPINQTNNISSNTTYEAIKEFWYNDITSNFFANIILFIRLTINGLISYLCTIVQSFFLNINLTQVQNPTDNNDLSYMLGQLTNTIYSIALDLSLLLFILSIWRYWTHAAWHGSGNVFSAIGRLIFTIGIMLAWPQIYSFQIELSNQMIKTLFADQSGQIQFLASILPNTFTSAFTAIPMGTAVDASTTEALSTFGSVAEAPIAIIVTIVLVLLGIILIYELLYVMVLKAIQMALMTAQFVFAPFFLVFFGNPVTDGIGATFLHSFVEVSLWNFIWIGLLKILIILLYSNFNPWGKILTAIGILQLMMQVPSFLAHAKISVASDFVSPHFFEKTLKTVSHFDEKLGHLLNTDKKKPTHPTPTPPTSESNNLNFANYQGNPDINTGPPTKNTNKSNRKSPNSNYQSTTDSSPNFNFGFNAFTAASGVSSGGAHSTTHSSAGPAFAFASAQSISSSISIATATAINNAGNKSSGPLHGTPPINPNPNSPPGTPPINPNPGFPSGTPPVNPNHPNSPPGNSPINPMPGSPPGTPLGFSPVNPNPVSPSGASPIYPGPGFLFVGAPPAHPNHPSPYAINPINPNAGSPTATAPTSANLPSPHKTGTIQPDLPLMPVISPSGNAKPGAPTNFYLGGNLNLDRDKTTLADIYIADITKNPNIFPLPKQIETNNKRLANQNQSINSNHSAESSAQAANNQPHTFNFSILSYLFYKNMRQSRLNSPFYHSNKTYGSVESLTGLAFYNLIFSYGNSPTLMGIPPIYPSVNRN